MYRLIILVVAMAFPCLAGWVDPDRPYQETDPVWAAASNAVQSNICAKLASNVWAQADSTTNYVRRTGDAIPGSLAVGAISAAVCRAGAFVVNGVTGATCQVTVITNIVIQYKNPGTITNLVLEPVTLTFTSGIKQ